MSYEMVGRGALIFLGIFVGLLALGVSLIGVIGTEPPEPRMSRRERTFWAFCVVGWFWLAFLLVTWGIA